MVKKNPFTTWHITVKVYTQEKTSREQIQRVHHGANKTRLDFAKKHLKKPDNFCKSILWTVEIKLNLYQNDGNGVWRKLTTSSVKHGGAV